MKSLSASLAITGTTYFAVVIVLAITLGRPGLRSLWHRIARRRVAWYWYLAGPALIVFYQGTALVINLLLGATVTNPPHLPTTGMLLELLLLGGLWEEPGWTGYALPKLQERFSNRPNGKLLAALVVGVFRSIWHLPLFFYGHIPWFDVIFFEMALQLIIAWLYNRSGGSVLVVILFHFTSNFLGAVFNPTFSGEARTMYFVLFMGLAVVVAAREWWGLSGSAGSSCRSRGAATTSPVRPAASRSVQGCAVRRSSGSGAGRWSGGSTCP